MTSGPLRGVWYDGRVATPHEADLHAEADVLVINAPGAEVRWPLDRVRASEAGEGRLRLTGPSDEEGRLLLAADAWRTLAGEHAARARTRARRRELKLVGALALVAAAGALFVFVGVPAAAGPLAAMTPIAFEERIGRNFEGQVTALFKPCRGNPSGEAKLASIGEALEARADTELNVRVRAVEAPMLNAFALPGGAVFVTDDLIAASGSPDELAGVIAHEIAHVEQRHVMRGVWRSLGAGLLLDLVVGGGSGAGQQAVLLAGSFTELSYSREMEAEADARGRELLRAAGLSSRGMASFFQKLSNERSGETARAFAEFLGSHPDSARRAAVARASEFPGRPALNAGDWQAVQRLCAGASDGPIETLQRRLPLGRGAPAADQVYQVREQRVGGGRP